MSLVTTDPAYNTTVTNGYTGTYHGIAANPAVITYRDW
jgi:hypothetical protein